MSQSAPLPEDLLRDLLCGLAQPGPFARSVGLLGFSGHSPHPPQHCLTSCLDGDPTAGPTRGCRLLAAAYEGRVDMSAIRNGRCVQGYEVVAQPTTVGGAPAVLLTVQGEPYGAGAGNRPPDLVGPLEAVSQLLQQIEQLAAENAGFADEVLRNYEQLNLIFDITQQIAQVTDVPAIERLLLQRLARLLGAPAACLLPNAGEAREVPAGEQAGPLRLDVEALATTLAEVRVTRRVLVARVGERSVIAGPLVRLDGVVDVVVVPQPPDRGEYTSGDVMIVESILTFGGQIISNTELHERLHHMSVGVTRALVAAIDKKDHYTSGHSERGGFLTRLTAAELGLTPAEQQSMEWAGLLHDVGKIGTPEEILCKPGKLTREEFEIIKQHPRMGYEILQPIASLQTILDGVLYHHEYPDGSGYPDGLSGNEIPLVARIIHVVDTFDALTSTRSYRKAFTVEEALAIIESEKGKRIDAEVADAFRRAFERYRREDPEDFALRFGHVLSEEPRHDL